MTKIKKTVESIEESPDLKNRKLEDQKEKLAQLTNYHKKLFVENAELRHENNALTEFNNKPGWTIHSLLLDAGSSRYSTLKK